MLDITGSVSEPLELLGLIGRGIVIAIFFCGDLDALMPEDG